MTDPRQHAENRGYIESFLRVIPGFRGYLEKEYRRESDALARTWLVDNLNKGKNILDNWGRTLVDAGQIDALPQIDRIRSRVDKITSRIKGAVSGYSGFFDFVQVNEELLDDVYEHDMSTIAEVDDFVRTAESFSTSVESPLSAASQLLSKLDEIEKRLNERSNLLNGLGSSA